MKLVKYLFPALLILSACNHPANKVTHAEPVVVTPQNDDTLLLTKPGAVSVRPNALQINTQKKKYPEGDFGVILDAHMLYMYECEHYLDSVQTYRVDREASGQMKFKTAGGKLYTLKLDTLFYDIILFNGKDKPVYADMMNMPKSYSDYMKK
jgi:hypothetical protein